MEAVPLRVRLWTTRSFPGDVRSRAPLNVTPSRKLALLTLTTKWPPLVLLTLGLGGEPGR
jgi:hypothetical protein